jgi:hypothetical protein
MPFAMDGLDVDRFDKSWPRASLSFFTATLMPSSKSTKTPVGQSRFSSRPRVTISPGSSSKHASTAATRSVLKATGLALAKWQPGLAGGDSADNARHQAASGTPSSVLSQDLVASPP